MNIANTVSLQAKGASSHHLLHLIIIDKRHSTFILLHAHTAPL